MKFLYWLWKLPWGWFLGIGTLIGAFYIWRSKRNEVATLQNAIEVQKLRERIARDGALVAELMQNANAHADVIDLFQKDIRASQERAVELGSRAALDKLRTMTDDEVSAAFTSLGF